jgi:hypothetical protein
MPAGRFAPAELHGLGRALWIAALVWAILFSGLAGLFASGYAMDDPGGLAGFGLVLAIFLPIILGSLLGWKLPHVAYPVLVAVTVLAVGFGMWQLIDPLTLRDLENRIGPVSAIGSFITMLPIVLVWRVRTWQAALMMLLIAVAGLLPEFRTHFALGSSGAVAVPMLLAAGLLGLAAALAQPR